MPRTGKGTVVRKAAVAAYSADVENMYSRSSSNKLSFRHFKIGGGYNETLTSLLQVFKALTGKAELSTDQDLYTSGMDSLKVMYTVRRLTSELQQTLAEDIRSFINPRLLYANPSVA